MLGYKLRFRRVKTTQGNRKQRGEWIEMPMQALDFNERERGSP